jgi:hypothetical protein
MNGGIQFTALHLNVQELVDPLLQHRELAGRLSLRNQTVDPGARCKAQDATCAATAFLWHR